MKCRFCNADVLHSFADLGMTPLANSYLKQENTNEQESFFPLCAYVCENCFLVQLDKFKKSDEIFTDYAYFSSYSKTWLKFAEDYANSLVNRFDINQDSLIIEIASNDGYLLQYFKKLNIPILGIEPAKNVAKVAQENGIPTITEFFGVNTAETIKKEKQADVIIANNVLPHVPDLNDFIEGLKILLKPEGIAVIQFSAYLPDMIQKTEYDVIYHEHFSYFSLYTIQKIFEKHNLVVFDVEENEIHGGSLRIYACHSSNTNEKFSITKNIQNVLEKEEKFGISKISTYTDFQQQINKKKTDVWNFFIDAEKSDKKIVAYGAPAKGNTLLNFCGIDKEMIEYTVDISPHKQGKYLPGTHIPIKKPEMIFETKPDYVVILAWNLKEEIMEQMKEIKSWGGKFVVFIPEVKIL